MGRSGVRPVVAETIAGLLNAGLAPVVPEFGSLGASGDLAPLAHCALALLGEGEVDDAGKRLPAAEALAAAGLVPLALSAKEGLALVNGTDGILGMLVLAVHDLGALLRVMDIAAAMSVEALLGTDRAFAADLQALRPHPGQQASAANLLPPARRLGDRRQPPRGRHPRAGRLLAALRAAGARSRPRRRWRSPTRSRRASSSRRSTTRWCSPTAASSRAGTSTAPRSATPATCSRSRPPTPAR